MKPVVSILVGSGFSIPEGIPSVRDLNKRLCKIHESEIMIHSSQTAIFLNGAEDKNRWMNDESRFFVQHFLEFYNSKILKEGENFHYETFFDFYSGYIHKGENAKEIERFYQQFNSTVLSNENHFRDCFNRLVDFDRTFNQLLASLLENRFYRNDISVDSHPRYESFIGFLHSLLKIVDVKFHTLNHDLFFDFIGKSETGLWQHFSDGFQLEGSPFYGSINFNYQFPNKDSVQKHYFTKVPHFTNKFDKALAFFKLHGSIDSKVLLRSHDRIRVKATFGVSDYYEEIKDSNDNCKFERVLDVVAPNFLSGTTNKIRFYDGDPHYKLLFEHFTNNLSNSELLIVIGYGFQDAGVNDFVEKNFLVRGKTMVVIDPWKPKTDLLEKYGALYIEKGITDVPFEEFQAVVGLLSQS